MPRKRFPIPKGIKRVNFSTRSMRDDLLDRMRTIAYQQSEILNVYYPLERVHNAVLRAGLDVVEPKVEAKFREHTASIKKKNRKKVA